MSPRASVTSKEAASGDGSKVSARADEVNMNSRRPRWRDRWYLGEVVEDHEPLRAPRFMTPARPCRRIGLRPQEPGKVMKVHGREGAEVVHQAECLQAGAVGVQEREVALSVLPQELPEGRRIHEQLLAVRVVRDLQEPSTVVPVRRESREEGRVDSRWFPGDRLPHAIAACESCRGTGWSRADCAAARLRRAARSFRPATRRSAYPSPRRGVGGHPSAPVLPCCWLEPRERRVSSISSMRS